MERLKTLAHSLRVAENRIETFINKGIIDEQLNRHCTRTVSLLMSTGLLAFLASSSFSTSNLLVAQEMAAYSLATVVTSGTILMNKPRQRPAN